MGRVQSLGPGRVLTRGAGCKKPWSPCCSVVVSWKGRGLQETSAPDRKVTAHWGFLTDLSSK